MAASRQVLPEAADQDTTTLRTLEQSANLPPMVIRWAFPTNLFLFVCLSGLGMPSIVAASTPEPLTVAQAQTLPTHELAEQIFGERIADKVIEAVRYEYPGRVPRYIEFYTMPELTNPRINGICRTDVITAEYELDNTVSGTPRPSSILNVTHVQAMGRYKAFVVPPGEPGTPENDRAQAKACARMTTALDAFHAPSAGDAQWLAAIEAEYLDPKQRFSFSCDDFSDKSCAKAKQKLSRLKLSLAKKVKSITCSKKTRVTRLTYVIS